MITPNLNATYDDFVSYEDSLATNRVISTGVNLLKPTLQTTTLNGVTCTNNGGTYTLNGTASNDCLFTIYNKDVANENIGLKKGVTYRAIGCPSGGSTETYYIMFNFWDEPAHDTGNGANKQFDSSKTGVRLDIIVKSGTVCNNLLFKPMITTNLNATYDDFISCLGTSWTQDSTNGYYTQSIICSGITSRDNPPIDVVLIGTLAEMQAQQEEWGKILKIETSTDTLKFYASEPTTVSLCVMVKGV